MAVSSLIGASVKRVEDPRMVTGTGSYVDDVLLPETLHFSVVRSPYSHARIKKVDTYRALNSPGVVLVLTGEEFSKVVPSLPMLTPVPGLNSAPRLPLAVDKVRYVGEPVAVVLAESKYQARDGAEVVEVEYEPLPSITDMEEAVKETAPVIHEQFKTNVAYKTNLKTPGADKAFKEADRIVKRRFVIQRLAPAPMEPRGVLASYQQATDMLTVWATTQNPHTLRTNLATLLGLSENKVRVIAIDVGGGFGSKIDIYSEEVIASYLSMKLGRPVKWIEDRKENLLGSVHGRDHIHYGEVAVKKDGTVLAVKAKILANMGAYLSTLTPLIPQLTMLMITGTYKIPEVDVDLQGVYTNTMSTDAYRGAGRPEATYFIERMMDAVAKELGMDPVEVRRINFIPPTDFPYKTATGLVYDSGDYEKPLKKALEIVDYKNLREEQRRLRKEEGRYIGIGFSTYVEICGLGPSAIMFAGGWESATVRVDPSGKVTVLTGSSPHGQGEETSFSQIVAAQLGVNIEDVTVVHGDTSMVQYGVGTYGSRTLAVGGTAIYNSCQKVKEKAIKFAANILEANPADMVYENGKVFVKGSPQSVVTLAQIAKEAYLAKKLPKDTEPGLEATTYFEPSNCTFPFGVHVAVVEAERETGEVKIRRYIAVDDCGNIVNPMLVEGQIHGGIAQSVGQALYEEVVYGEGGQMQTATFMDYLMPSAVEIPKFETASTVTPSPVNPLGVKGVGEAGTIACTPALLNAIEDALSPFNAKVDVMPVKTEAVWRAMNTGIRR
jgi:carbon-monoxide dehydrogenase large subunit